ncbi:hypothetical protein GGR52DRAFT_585195, partial [Hypoxylon sp. FL1284]
LFVVIILVAIAAIPIINLDLDLGRPRHPRLDRHPYALDIGVPLIHTIGQDDAPVQLLERLDEPAEPVAVAGGARRRRGCVAVDEPRAAQQRLPEGGVAVGGAAQLAVVGVPRRQHPREHLEDAVQHVPALRRPQRRRRPLRDQPRPHVQVRRAPAPVRRLLQPREGVEQVVPGGVVGASEDSGHGCAVLFVRDAVVVAAACGYAACIMTRG